MAQRSARFKNPDRSRDASNLSAQLLRHVAAGDSGLFDRAQFDEPGGLDGRTWKAPTTIKPHGA